MLEILSFTGVDIHTDPEDLSSIAKQFPQAEFAVLIGSPTGNLHPLFPPLNVVHRLKSMSPTMRTALHLCGKYARATMRTGPMAEETMRLCNGFGRVQINLHGEWLDSPSITVVPEALREFADTVQTDSVILQHRAGWDSTPFDHPNVEYLFDLSEGRGAESFEAWPPPPPSKRVGYAGGIGPHNIHRAMTFADLHPDTHIWLDMESQIRDMHHRLDLDKVRAVCQAAFNRPQAPSAPQSTIGPA